MLSARTLACFLASQDDPEKGLCPHELVISVETRESKGHLKKSLHRRTEPALDKDYHLGHEHHEPIHTTVGLTQGKDSPESSPDPRSDVQARYDSEDRRGKPISQSRLHRNKDPKSFTQNLFDTTPLKLLQEYIPVQYRQWSSCLERSQPTLAGPVHHRVARKEARQRKYHGNLNSNNLQGSEPTHPESINAEAAQSVMSTVKCPTMTHWSASANQQGKSGKRASMNGVPEKQRPLRIDGETVISPWKRSKAIADNVVGTSLIPPGGDRPSFKHEGPYHSDSDGNLETMEDAPRSRDRTRAVSWTGLASRLRLQEHSPSVGLSNVAHSHKNANSIQRTTAHPRDILDGLDQPADELWKPAETLSHLTPENIDSLVRMIKAAEPSLCDGRRHLRSIGRTDTSYLRPNALFHGSSTEVQRTLAFGVQSLNYVLGNTAALLKSFLCRAASEDVPNVVETKCTINAGELLYQFRNLMEIDHHPRTILPSLWIATGVLFNTPLAHTHPRISDLRAGTALLNARQNHSADHVSHDLSNETYLDDTDAAHIVKIVLAALGATVPNSKPETWLAVQKLRASGHVAPEVLTDTWDSRIVMSLLEAMDAFEDEAALALMTRLVRAISARRCMSEMAKNKTSSRGYHTTPANASHNMMKSILDFLMQNGTVNAEVNNASANTSKILPFEQGAVNGQLHESPKDALNVKSPFPAVTVEWLRSVLLKEWNGKAEVAKWGAVGGAIEMMSSFCKLFCSFLLCISVVLI